MPAGLYYAFNFTKVMYMYLLYVSMYTLTHIKGESRKFQGGFRVDNKKYLLSGRCRILS